MGLCGWASSADVPKASKRWFLVGFALGLRIRDLSPLGFLFPKNYVGLIPYKLGYIGKL